MLVGQSDGSCDLYALVFGVVDQLVGDLLHGVESISAESDPGLLHLLILDALLLVLVSHMVK